MLMLAGIMGVVLAGLAFDMSSPDDGVSLDDHVDSDPESESLPRSLPEAADGEQSADVSPAENTKIEASTLPTPSKHGYDGRPPEDTSSHEIFLDPADSSGGSFVLGGAEDDALLGSEQADEMRGAGGDDTLSGLGDDDWIQGDSEQGPAGNDVISGGAGDDWLAGQGGNDTIYGDEGDDTLYGGDGDDSLFGGEGDDSLIASSGADKLFGNAGNDVLIGDDSRDHATLSGGDGDDTLMPGSGDLAEGDAGRDRFILSDGDGEPATITDFNAAEDEIFLHLPSNLQTNSLQIEVSRDTDGQQVITVNGDAVGKLLQTTDLQGKDIKVVWVHD